MIGKKYIKLASKDVTVVYFEKFRIWQTNKQQQQQQQNPTGINKQL